MGLEIPGVRGGGLQTGGAVLKVDLIVCLLYILDKITSVNYLLEQVD